MRIEGTKSSVFTTDSDEIMPIIGLDSDFDKETIGPGTIVITIT